VNNAGTTMSEVVVSVQQNTQFITDISKSCNEQKVNIGVIYKVIAETDQIIQQNAALVEEAAAASESLNQQARHLTEIVSVFQS
jgi:methyl-accepting chemotaxis protein